MTKQIHLRQRPQVGTYRDSVDAGGVAVAVAVVAVHAPVAAGPHVDDAQAVAALKEQCENGHFGFKRPIPNLFLSIFVILKQFYKIKFVDLDKRDSNLDGWS